MDCGEAAIARAVHTPSVPLVGDYFFVPRAAARPRFFRKLFLIFFGSMLSPIPN
jgi:hypothetical protein